MFVNVYFPLLPYYCGLYKTTLHSYIILEFHMCAICNLRACVCVGFKTIMMKWCYVFVVFYSVKEECQQGELSSTIV